MDTFRARYCSDPQSRKKWMIYGGAAGIVTVVLIIIIAVAASGGGWEPEFRGSSVLTDVPLIEGSNFLPIRLDKNNLVNFNFSVETPDQTDLVKLRKGKVGALFFVASADCNSNYKDAVQKTLDQIDLIKRLIDANPKDLKFVTRASEIRDAFDNDQIACLIGINGGHSIDSRHSLLRLYYSLGVRYLTITQSGCNTPWADSNEMNDKKDKQIDITSWGKEVIQEMNRLGMIIDLSGASDNVIDTVLRISNAPIIFSHSSAYFNNNHPLNVKNETLVKLKKNGGIIMVNFEPKVLSSNVSESTIADAIDHLNSIREIVGSEHIGIGGSFDRSDKKTKELEDVSTYPALFDRLGFGENISNSFHNKWSKDDLTLLAGDNFIRVFEAVEDFKHKSDIPLQESAISVADLENRNATQCRSDIPEPMPTPTVPTVPTEPTVSTIITESTDSTLSSTSELVTELKPELITESTQDSIIETH